MAKLTEIAQDDCCEHCFSECTDAHTEVILSPNSVGYLCADCIEHKEAYTHQPLRYRGGGRWSTDQAHREGA